MCDLVHKALEGDLADEELGGLLLPADFAQGDGTGAVPVRLLDSARRHPVGGGLAGRFRSQLLTGCLTAR